MADLVERLRVRWEATDEPVAKKVNRFIKERKEAADAIEAKDRKIAELHAALTTASPHMPVPAGWVLVPVAALKWLNGEGPDGNGHGFGDAPDDNGRGAFWWRKKFTDMLDAAPKPAALTQEPKPAEGEK